MSSRHIHLVLVFALVVGLVLDGWSQTQSTKRCFELSARQTYSFDTVAINPNTFVLTQHGDTIPNSQYSYDHETQSLHVNIEDTTGVLNICFRTLPTQLTRTYFLLKKPEAIASRAAYEFEYQASTIPDLQSTYTQLDKSGSVSRGISVGNGRDVSLTGGLNLQMSGKITPNLWLAASLTDANIPIQPEGNTAQLSEFDKIFIQVYNDKTSTTLGDYQLSLRNSRFMQLNRKQQGFLFEVKEQEPNSASFSYSGTTSASVSKGKYHRQTLLTMEGKQGPYRLQGANNERYIMVLSGSERVYINGVLMERGENSDYVIDYNAAEVIFTPRKPISRESRVVVEFEYTDRTYARFLTAHTSTWKNKQSRFSFSIASESDAKNQTIDIDYKDEWIDLLSEIGDNVDSAIVENAQEVLFDLEAVRYARIDTSYQGVDYQIYKYSINPDSAKYSVGFSYMGQGGGDYISLTGLVNGRVYGWVAPVNGAKQGDYAPVTVLVPPKSKQNIVLNGEHRFLNNACVYSEVAYSHSDLNTFSKLDNDDNHGIAFLSGVNVGTDSSLWSLLGEYQYVHRYFDTFQRFRSSEFERDWNISSMTERFNEHYAKVGAGLYKKNRGKLNYLTELFSQELNYKGVRNNLSGVLTLNNFTIETSGSIVNAMADTTKSQFISSLNSVGYALDRFKIGARFQIEDNRKTLHDSILDIGAFSFYDISAYAERVGEGKLTGKFSVGIRDDQKTANNQLTPFTNAKYIQSEGDFAFSPSHKWGYLFNYKNIEVRNAENWENVNSDNIVSGRITNRFALFKRMFTSSSFYEIGSGLESKKEYAYLCTAPGEGTHIWRDLNGNGIREISEFEQASIPAEADFIRIFIPTGEYMSAYYCRFRINTNLNFDRWKSNKNVLLRGISQISNQTNFQVNQKITDNTFGSYANPFFNVSSDTVLLSNQLSFRSVFSYGRSNPKWGIDYTIGNNENRHVLASGFETRASDNQSVVLRFNPLLFLTFLNESAMVNSNYESQAFSQKNYTIEARSNQTKFLINLGAATRFEAIYKYAEKENSLSQNRVEAHEFTVGFNYSKARKGNFNGSIGYILNKFMGENENDPANYELLEGYQIGKNLTWQLGSIINLAKKFQLTLQYHGRSAPEMKTIHTGSVLVKAFF
ncbi:MAG: hypothetical protein PHU27_05725 [Salinivirgaceae bacterium]|nr:hypothetical protein [Salinivirgaceae bacterium]